MVVQVDPGFTYAPSCAMPDCDRPPVCKLMATWAFGPMSERKNYGLACDAHRDELLARARDRRRALVVGDDERVGPVEAIPLGPAPPAG